MPGISNATRISIGLTLVTLSVIAGANLLGLVPRSSELESKQRLHLSQTVALQFSVSLQDDDPDQMLLLAESVLAHSPDITSMAIRRADGSLLFASAGHDTAWGRDQTRPADAQQIEVPLQDEAGVLWGNVEIMFAPLPGVLFGEWSLFVFIAMGCLLVFMLYMARTLKGLDPSSVIPDRVKAALDTLVEGALVIDLEDQIMLANQSMCAILEREPAEMLGTVASDLGWLDPEEDHTPTTLPWHGSAQSSMCRGKPIRLRTPKGPRMLMVNATPILGGGDKARGVLVTFNDVTSIEEKNKQLIEMVKRLGEAQEQVKQQNMELQRNATRDALTGCLNRRAFHEQLSTLTELAHRSAEPFSVMMLDIDHFKKINDTHGHLIGDQVLRAIAKRLLETTRRSDVVCRYGGEEFCILMPETAIEGAAVYAEILRDAVAGRPIEGIDVTASFGVDELGIDDIDAEQLINRADAALYCAKQTGRNRVVRADHVDEQTIKTRTQSTPTGPSEYISIQATTAVFAALRYRDPQTAEHSRRVAELCVRFAAGGMNPQDLLVFEVAAMLHDIGKIGVPDSILLKPAALTKEEWEVMDRHDRIGIEILKSFECQELVDIVRCHHAYFNDPERSPHLPSGRDIPLRARLLCIADAYDAMTNDRVYRKAMSKEAAFAELRRCAGTQFDPDLVEAFIAMLINEGDQIASQSGVENQLRIGMEVERLSSALIRQDVPSIGVLAERLTATATSLGQEKVAQIAKRVGEAAEVDFDLNNLLDQVHEMLDLCASYAPEDNVGEVKPKSEDMHAPSE